ncbi:DNA/RNA non-specific endonuclease [Colletotrichum navitas]|uniref:Endonuclease n=1 Tax=Colletotrichum navitas TaxID=681940 RepID=A0AAD8QAS8_9PEZI|nr:DNA/RNA non-specific endonuclease [Colletotrichum navitas]KAK1598616.1 DNA/RNA non-specific endonuclease [Colletotrichum navitas]
MSKTTSLALIAALSAGGGAALTATMYSLRSPKQPAPSTANASLPSNSPSVPVPATQVFANPSAPVPPAAAAPSPPLPGSVSGSPVDPAGLFEYGFPGPVADLAQRPALISSYDRRTRNPHWVIEHITPASLAQRSGDRKNSAFVEDTSIPEKFQAKLKDYFRSGYDRGHQVPAADCKWSQKAMDDTFYLSNMCPQVGDGFNRDYWAHFEDFCRRLTTRYPSVRIVTGPLYLPKRDPVDGKWYTKYEVIGNPPNVAVPTHFYKVIFAEDGKAGGNVAIGAFVMPNAPIPNDKPLSDFEMPLEAVERAAGVEFASKLAPQRRKRLCSEASCAIVVKEYADRQKSFGKGGSQSRSPSP